MLMQNCRSRNHQKTVQNNTLQQHQQKREKEEKNEYRYRYKESTIVILLGDLCPFMVHAGE